MADVSIRSEWTITLSTEELRLVLRSLGGRMAAATEMEEAKKLGDRLTVLRATATKTLTAQAEAALKAVETANSGSEGNKI